jgi:hypothetical protein
MLLIMVLLDMAEVTLIIHLNHKVVKAEHHLLAQQALFCQHVFQLMV